MVWSNQGHEVMAEVHYMSFGCVSFSFSDTEEGNLASAVNKLVPAVGS